MFGVPISNTATKKAIKKYLDGMSEDDVLECYLRFKNNMVCIMDHGVSDMPADKFLLDLRSDEYKKRCEEDEQ